ncbi:MAG: hypothetical protein CO021_07440 [Deltaproteobacteria bacterium CG_4_9_14_0_2_um_filter_42_21]|nr:MAG: hypothetical protein CO021_07440 [Deltaproteobacteria bacterium CG_4_9_14_0_2_um_filter_42_21]
MASKKRLIILSLLFLLGIGFLLWQQYGNKVCSFFAKPLAELSLEQKQNILSQHIPADAEIVLFLDASLVSENHLAKFDFFPQDKEWVKTFFHEMNMQKGMLASIGKINSSGKLEFAHLLLGDVNEKTFREHLLKTFSTDLVFEQTEEKGFRWNTIKDDDAAYELGFSFSESEKPYQLLAFGTKALARQMLETKTHEKFAPNNSRLYGYVNPSERLLSLLPAEFSSLQKISLKDESGMLNVLFSFSDKSKMEAARLYLSGLKTLFSLRQSAPNTWFQHLDKVELKAEGTNLLACFPL